MADVEEGASVAVTRTRAIYERIRREIIQGTLPPGEKLRIEVLRTRYNVGGTPVREAMNRVSTEGLVAQSEQRGFRVTPVSADDLLELTRTRCWINEVALRESIARGGRDWEEHVLLSLHRLSRIPIVVDNSRMNPDWSELHRVFHAALLAGCGSRWVMDFNDLLFDCAERYRNLLAVIGAVRGLPRQQLSARPHWPSGCSTIITRRRVGRCCARSRPAGSRDVDQRDVPSGL